MTYINQMLDTSIKVAANSAFAMVTVEIIDDKGEPVTVRLDMESFVRVMEPMDQGQMAVAEMEAKVKSLPWMQRPMTTRTFFVVVVLFTAIGYAFGLLS